MYPHQAARLTEALQGAGVEALVATSPGNVAYITGYRRPPWLGSGSERFAVFAVQGNALVVPAVDVPAVVADGADADHVVCFGDVRAAVAERASADAKRVLDILAGRCASPAAAVARALEMLGVPAGAVGVDESGLGHDGWERVTSGLGGGRAVSVAAALGAARRVKGPYEIECLARALAACEEALNEVIQALEVGMTEREAAQLFATGVIKRGGMPTAVLVATGERTAIPGAWPGERALRRRELVRLDVGCVVKGYHASLARMAVMGEPTGSPDAVYPALPAALEAAIGAVRAGVPASTPHAAAVQAARAAGLGTYDAAGAGHGIGLAPCEEPLLSPARETPLLAGEVLCVEATHLELGSAGHGVRDTVVVTTSGAQVLNRSSRGLCVLD